LHEYIDTPILFDLFHHICFDSNLSINEAIQKASSTWNRHKDGLMMIDYSSQEPNQRKGKHSETLDTKQFEKFILSVSDYDFDVILELKDKEKSAAKALKVLNKVNYNYRNI